MSSRQPTIPDSSGRKKAVFLVTVGHAYGDADDESDDDDDDDDDG